MNGTNKEWPSLFPGKNRLSLIVVYEIIYQKIELQFFEWHNWTKENSSNTNPNIKAMWFAHHDGWLLFAMLKQQHSPVFVISIKLPIFHAHWCFVWRCVWRTLHSLTKLFANFFALIIAYNMYICSCTSIVLYYCLQCNYYNCFR